MTINWTQDEHGNRDFIHEGWSVRIWALENSGLFRDKGVNRIHVEPPARSRWCADEVDVYDKGISVGSGVSWIPSPFRGQYSKQSSMHARL